MTFSIVARCARTGQFGLAVASSSPAVASRCAFARAGVGAVATQNITDPTLGPRGLDLLERGASAGECVAILTRSRLAAYRQLSVIDVTGDTDVWSGAQTLGIHGSAKGHNVACAGNLLAEADVPVAMRDAFAGGDTGQELGQRLLEAMQAGLAAGGEAGPIRSAGLLVVDAHAWPLTDLRVDWDERPIDRLQALWSLWAPQARDYTLRAIDPATSPSYGVPGDE
ncbi:DUF1028 domain-containing protein [Gluconacetobacter tumulicola]|uniref:DUF1028 domain-containing protein n=1 Tax=Gluconacetobacter tumulicola TaxID=1017177 RepID=A0A7W4JBI7_9PROT|nr:DUF1028 domain-containing protein [Gluconacetobacter tumulicola]MBB2178176.1 DUF1028 domain-containing protein [Gluconacetobacter tumulicola]